MIRSKDKRTYLMDVCRFRAPYASMAFVLFIACILVYFLESDGCRRLNSASIQGTEVYVAATDNEMKRVWEECKKV